MSENSIYELSKWWDPHRLKHLFEGMDAGIASTIAGITGLVILALRGY